MAVRFSHDLMPYDLVLRLDPTHVEWNYNLNTSITPTYGGQVIQILSINYDQLIIQGRFGREGPHGIFYDSAKRRWEPRPPSEAHDFRTNNPLKIGITQMTSWFQEYFAVASQGHDAQVIGQYDQTPVKVTYGGGFDDMALDGRGTTERTWLGYPVDFPSYSRAIEEFTPEWSITLEVEEPDYAINTSLIDKSVDELNALKAGVGFTPFNPFSDPLAAFLPTDAQKRNAAIKAILNHSPDNLQAKYNNIVDEAFDHFNSFITGQTPDVYANLVFSGASLPSTIIADQVAKDLGLTQQTQNKAGGIVTNSSTSKSTSVPQNNAGRPTSTFQGI